MQTQTTQPLPRYSQYTVRLVTPRVWRTLASGHRKSSSVTYFRQPPNLPTAACRNRKCTECDTTAFGDCFRYPNAETECPPKVPIYPHSAPKPKPKFGRPLVISQPLDLELKVFTATFSPPAQVDKYHKNEPFPLVKCIQRYDHVDHIVEYIYHRIYRKLRY